MNYISEIVFIDSNSIRKDHINVIIAIEKLIEKTNDDSHKILRRSLESESRLQPFDKQFLSLAFYEEIPWKKHIHTPQDGPQWRWARISSGRGFGLAFSRYNAIHKFADPERINGLFVFELDRGSNTFIHIQKPNSENNGERVPFDPIRASDRFFFHVPLTRSRLTFGVVRVRLPVSRLVWFE